MEFLVGLSLLVFPAVSFFFAYKRLGRVERLLTELHRAAAATVSATIGDEVATTAAVSATDDEEAEV